MLIKLRTRSAFTQGTLRVRTSICRQFARHANLDFCLFNKYE